MPCPAAFVVIGVGGPTVLAGGVAVVAEGVAVPDGGGAVGVAVWPAVLLCAPAQQAQLRIQQSSAIRFDIKFLRIKDDARSISGARASFVRFIPVFQQVGGHPVDSVSQE